jgi:hypothetical protein
MRFSAEEFMRGSGQAASLLSLQKKYVSVKFGAAEMLLGTDPPEEEMHVLRTRVDHHIVYVLALDFLEDCSIGVWICLSEVHLHVFVARRPHKFSQLDETCKMQKCACLTCCKETYCHSTNVFKI